MKKNLVADTMALLLISLMLINSLTFISSNVSYAYDNSMTFTSDETINFSSTTEMSFWSGETMWFGTGIRMQFIETIPDGVLEPCDYVMVLWPAGYIPPECSWWEVLDDLGNPTGFEFHADGSMPPDVFHIDYVWPAPIQVMPGGVINAEMKIDSIKPCDYFVVHWPVDWWPEPCTWWEIIDPETGIPTGYEFHVDWTNESCEFHVDGMIPGPYTLPWYYYEVEARRKITEIKPCDWFFIIDPPCFLPEYCSWWEILDAKGLPTGLEFHVDEAGGDMFHVDGVLPDPLEIPPTYPTVARKKIDMVMQCEWYKVSDPTFPLEPCSWWRIIRPDIGDVEFHIDQVPGDGTFHVDISTQDVPFSPPVPFVVAEEKIDDIVPCDWFKVIDPQDFYPELCSWWVITDPQQWAGIIFHVDDHDGASRFHIDEVVGQLIPLEVPTWTVTAEPYSPPDPWYYKSPYDDYAPSGVPDFDQRQWGSYNWTDMWGAWSHCGPVAVANSLWWLDSEFEPTPIPPPTINDGFPLVQAYGPWDDHDPQNVPWLVEHLAHLMDTDGMITGIPHIGTNVYDMEAGLAHYLSWSGVNPLGDVNGDGIVDPIDEMMVLNAWYSVPGSPNWDLAADIWPASITYPPAFDNHVDENDLFLVQTNMGLTGLFYEHTVEQPDFYYIEEEVERCQDVVLLLGYWIFDEYTGGWYRESGHYVTVAGVNSEDLKIAISDPMEDAFENGLIPEGRIPIPHVHMPPEPPYITHNDAAFVSHDIYDVAMISPPFPPCPGGNWMLVNYVNWWPVPPYFTVIEYAVITSPYEVPEHDIAVTSVTVREILNRGDLTIRNLVNITVLNEGYYTETFDVTVYVENSTIEIAIGTQTVIDLASSTSTTLNFPWNTDSTWTLSALCGNYTVRAYAWPVAGETDLLDNNYIDDEVILKNLGDLGGPVLYVPTFFAFDGKVDGNDLALFVQCYKGLAPLGAKYLGDLGGPVSYVPTFFAYDGKVDGNDLALFVSCYKGLGP